MPVTVIDYSRIHYEVLQGGSTPAQRGGKFVVMRGKDGKFMVFSPSALSKYHANIVERFLNRHRIKGRYNPRGDYFRFSSEDWTVEGGGCWAVDEDCGVLEIWGESQAYGGVDLGMVAAEVKNAGGFAAVSTVRIRS